MADPNQDQDDLVSQEDIDKLLASSSIEEAEENLETVDISSEIDDLDELSQDDIDSLMGGQTAAVETDDPEEDSELSRDDIDSLLNSGPEDTPGNAPENRDDDAGELSQSDIDSLLGGGPVNPADDGPGEYDSPDIDLEDDIMADDEEEIELIDQSDIDRLMAEPRDEAVSDAAVSLESADPQDIPESGNGREPSDRDDFVISPDQAADPADCLVTQDTLDALMQNVPDTALPSDVEALEEENPAGIPEADEADLDALLLDDPPPETGQTDVTQEDIDALLQDPDEDTEDAEKNREQENTDVVDLEDGDDLLISQDDIDTLLMADDQEDEDILEDVLGSDFEDMLDDESGDEYSRENGEEHEGPGSDQVVLEASDAKETLVAADKPSPAGRKWYRSKLLLAAASVFLVLTITVPAAYFLFFPRMPELPEANQPISQAAREMAAEMVTDNVAAESPAPDSAVQDNVQVEVVSVPAAVSGSMVMKNFIVLTSDQAVDMAYVTLDISIDYSDQRAYDEINSNRAFFRDLIYKSIQQNLVWEKRNEVTQNDLIRGVEAGLQKVLPPGYIDNISFLSFKTS